MADGARAAPHHRLDTMGPIRSCSSNAVTEWQPPKTKKSPAAIRPPGCNCNLGHILFLDLPMLRAEHRSTSIDLNRCDHAKNPLLSQHCHAHLVITELPAQDLLCMLA